MQVFAAPINCSSSSLAGFIRVFRELAVCARMLVELVVTFSCFFSSLAIDAGLIVLEPGLTALARNSPMSVNESQVTRLSERFW